MSDRAQMLGGCCGGRDDSVTQIQLDAVRAAGIRGLSTAFEQLRMRGRTPEDVTDAELLGVVREQHNYIIDKAQIEALYAAALRREYAAFCARLLKR
jgi:hypothetical protein